MHVHYSLVTTVIISLLRPPLTLQRVVALLSCMSSILSAVVVFWLACECERYATFVWTSFISRFLFHGMIVGEDTRACMLVNFKVATLLFKDGSVVTQLA